MAELISSSISYRKLALAIMTPTSHSIVIGDAGRWEGYDVPCPSTPPVQQARGRQHHHSKFGGVGRLWSKD
jgi:hypothetical protein